MMIFFVAVIQHSYTRRPATRTGVAQVRCDDFFLVFFWHVFRSRGTATSTTSSLSLRLDPTVCEFPSPLVTVFDVPVAHAGLIDAWGVGQHLEHRSSDLSESDVLFLWLLCAEGKCFDHLQAHQTLDQPAYASMRA